jgi:hypothetical protein
VEVRFLGARGVVEAAEGGTSSFDEGHGMVLALEPGREMTRGLQGFIGATGHPVARGRSIFFPGWGAARRGVARRGEGGGMGGGRLRTTDLQGFGRRRGSRGGLMPDLQGFGRRRGSRGGLMPDLQGFGGRRTEVRRALVNNGSVGARPPGSGGHMPDLQELGCPVGRMQDIAMLARRTVNRNPIVPSPPSDSAYHLIIHSANLRRGFSHGV